MATSPVNGLPSSTLDALNGVTATKKDDGSERFLKLLVTQMKNQDPTKPMESTDYIAQLATFSQVEQTVQTNSKIDQLMQMSLLGQADAIIGRTVTSADGAVSGQVAEVRIGSAGLIAVLADGTEFPVEAGMTVS